MSIYLIELIKKRAQNLKTIHDMVLAFNTISQINPVVEPIEIEKAERILGFKLPLLLKSILCHIGNGGFGPGFGMYKLSKMVKIYQEYMTDKSKNWQKGWLPVLNWGNSHESCIDCIALENPVYLIQTIENENFYHCLKDIPFSLVNTDGRLITSGNIGSVNDEFMTSPVVIESNLQRPSFQKFMSDWVRGINLFAEIIEKNHGNSWMSKN